MPELALVGDGEDRFLFLVENGKAKRIKVAQVEKPKKGKKAR